MKFKKIFEVKSKRLFINYYVLPIIILIAICCLGIGYAAMNINLEITGTLAATAQEGIFISNIVADENSNISYSGTILHSNFDLGNPRK